MTTKNYIFAKNKTEYSRKPAFKRYEYNKSRLGKLSGYIFRQDDDKIKDFRYGGFFRLGKNGCGAIAIYNTMLALGKHEDLCDIMLEIELNHILRANGLLGTSPKKLTRFFDARDIHYEVFNSLESYKRRMNSFNISIIFVQEHHSPAQHYYCIIKRGENDFQTINQYYRNGFGKPSWNNKFLKAYCFKIK